MKAGGVVLWLGGCASLSCSVDKPTREPIQPESWEDNFRLSVARPGKVEGELKADWVQSLQQSTPAFPCTICSSFGREFQLILYWKEEKHSLLVKKLSTSKSQVTIVSISLSSANAFPKNYFSIFILPSNNSSGPYEASLQTKLVEVMEFQLSDFKS